MVIEWGSLRNHVRNHFLLLSCEYGSIHSRWKRFYYPIMGPMSRWHDSYPLFSMLCLTRRRNFLIGSPQWQLSASNSLFCQWGPINCIYRLWNEVWQMLEVNDSYTNLHRNEFISLGMWNDPIWVFGSNTAELLGNRSLGIGGEHEAGL